jgi:hypothetical protein
MSTSDRIIADLGSIAHSKRSPGERRHAVDRLLTAFRNELDRWAASEPTDGDLLREKGTDLDDRLATRLREAGLAPEEREVLEYALSVQQRATHIPTA